MIPNHFFFWSNGRDCLRHDQNVISLSNTPKTSQIQNQKKKKKIINRPILFQHISTLLHWIFVGFGPKWPGPLLTQLH